MVSPPTAPALTKVDGVTVVQRSVTSNRSPLELATHFAGAFEKAGFYIAPEQDQMKPMSGMQMSGLDTENLLSYTAILQPAGKGTTVVLAVADLAAKKPIAEPIGPVYPGATAVTSFALESQKAMSYSVVATPAEIKTFYKDTFSVAGYRESAPLIFQKGNEQYTVTVSPGITERYVLLKLDLLPGLPPPDKTRASPAPPLPASIAPQPAPKK